MKSKGFFWLIAIALYFQRCDLNEDSNAVVTEDVIFVGSEVARFSGRIIGSDGKLTNHGFEVSQDIDFVDPVLVENGEPESLGLYVGLVDGLEPNQGYYFRAFATGAESITYGNVVSFTTLSPEVSLLRPSIAFIGDEVTIVVQNFTSDAEIFFGDQKAEITSVEFESIVTVLVPEIRDDFVVPVTVRMRGTTYDLGNFEYIIGRWRDEPLVFPDASVNIFEAVYAQSESGFVLGLGFDQRVTYNYEHLWYLDFASFEWSEIPYFGPGAQGSFRAKGCFGNGKFAKVTEGYSINDELYCLDDADLILDGNTPFKLSKAIAAKVDGDTFVYGGFKENAQLNNVAYRYSNGGWTELGTHPIIPSPPDTPYLLDTISPSIINEIPNFVVDDRAFIIYNGVVWEFNTSTLGFEEHDNVPIRNCLRGVTQVMNEKVYLGICQGVRQEFYEYDPIGKVWKSKNSFPFSGHKYNVGSFTHQDRIYMILNQLDGRDRLEPREVITYSINPDEF